MIPAMRRWSHRMRLRIPQPVSWEGLSFRNKILITILSGMTTTMLLVGVVTVYYIYNQYNKDVLENLRKKTRSITTEIDGYTQQADASLPSANEDFSSFVKELSRTYQSDINVFDIHGMLITTTQELIYENNVLAPRIDPAAYMKFYVGNASQLIQDEKIGTLKYISSYMPLRNKEGIVTGFVNLPYFSKAQELNDRISSFVVALVNLYLLLLLVLLTIGLVMARRLTSPFEILRSHLLSIDLGKPGEVIVWKNKDEIGKLIQAYNSLVNGLQESARRLADAERERGWKDIAQNIAHDIKNPLMPMKLHLQILQKNMQENPEKLLETFPRVANLLIRQIDLLAETANEINDFAKLSKGNPERVDLKKAISDVVYLFSHQDERAIHCLLPKEDLCVIIDPAQLSRVFNNLVKNALQAIPEGKKGIVQLAAYKDGADIIIKIEDNGKGISEENKSNIFTPRFSTKTSGTGLGLAIVRRIIELAGGTINFTSAQNMGTTFTIRLPECK
jgi:signal transduction histidine kinase